MMALQHALAVALGWLLVVVGLILWPLPIPLGLLMTSAGVILLLSSSRWLRRLARRARARSQVVDRALSTLLRFAPARLRQQFHEDGDSL